MKTGDKVKFKDYGNNGQNHVSGRYDYAESKKLADLLGINVATRLVAHKNEGTIIADHANYTNILVEYTDSNGYTGVLFFKREVLELIVPKEEVINQYEIY